MSRVFAFVSHRIVVTALVAAIAFAAGLAVAVHAAGSTTVIYACVTNSNGSIRIVPEGTACKSNETALNWNQQGPQGPPGPPGGTSGGTGTVIGYLGAYDWDTGVLIAPAGATVYIPNTTAIATVNSEGRFELHDVPLGTWSIYYTFNQPPFCYTPSATDMAHGIVGTQGGGYIYGVSVTQAGQVVEIPDRSLYSACYPVWKR